MSPFNPATDIPALAGKTILITGANSGLGLQSSLELARHSPSQLWMAARSPQKGKDAVADVKRQVPGANLSFLEIDLSSFSSIKNAAKMVLDSSPRLDVLMLNAGLMGCPPQLTQEGYEMQMGTNHVGHALLLKLLMPLLAKTDGARVVSLASSAWKYIGPEGIQFDTLKSSLQHSVDPVSRYIQSKTANMLYAQAFARRHHDRDNLVVVSVDPGEVATNLTTREHGDERMRHIATQVAPSRQGPVEEGAKNQLWAATAPLTDLVSGRHYEPVGEYRLGELMLDEQKGDKVWEWTERELEGQEI